jgi:secondary thiamine-phosphate synthase enzyme
MTFEVGTSGRACFVNITGKVEDAVARSGVKDGVVTVFIPHTTAGITINEAADPAVVRDILNALDELVPRNRRYTHAEGNSDAHIKASLMGSSVNVPVSNGRLALGTWQGIFLCEFDGPRHRSVLIRVTG